MHAAVLGEVAPGSRPHGPGSVGLWQTAAEGGGVQPLSGIYWRRSGVLARAFGRHREVCGGGCVVLTVGRIGSVMFSHSHAY